MLHRICYRVLPVLQAILMAVSFAGPVRATFSITAVDPATGQVGSAGASCISGAIILSDVHPGVGAVHTQAYWNNQNQQYARTLMNLGYPPQAIIDSLVAHDAQGNPTIRQYGIVDLEGGGRSAGFTGSNCTDYKGHILGPTYAIQGNILLGPEILEGMEDAFLTTPGTLADRLMAALQAAKVPGADTRCAGYGKSSISAFLRVARPSDGTNFMLNLNVNNTPPSQDPIDLLQGLYEQWQVSGVPQDQRPDGDGLALYPGSPNPFRSATLIAYEIPRSSRVNLSIYDITGRLVDVLVDEERFAGAHQVAWSGPGLSPGTGVYFCRLEFEGRRRTARLICLR